MKSRYIKLTIGIYLFVCLANIMRNSNFITSTFTSDIISIKKKCLEKMLFLPILEKHDKILYEIGNVDNTGTSDINAVYLEKTGKTVNSWNITQMRFDFLVPPTSMETNYTILLFTYDRVDRCKKSLLHYSSFRSVHKIIVIWNNPMLPIPQPLRRLSEHLPVPVIFVHSPIRGLNNRFLPRDIIETQGKTKTEGQSAL